MGAQVIEKQWGIVEDSDRDDKRQVGRRGAGKGHPFSLPDNTYIAAQSCLLSKNVQTKMALEKIHSDQKDTTMT